MDSDSHCLKRLCKVHWKCELPTSVPKDTNEGSKREMGPGGASNELTSCPGSHVTKMICGPTWRNADLRTGMEA